MFLLSSIFAKNEKAASGSLQSNPRFSTSGPGTQSKLLELLWGSAFILCSVWREIKCLPSPRSKGLKFILLLLLVVVVGLNMSMVA